MLPHTPLIRDPVLPVSRAYVRCKLEILGAGYLSRARALGNEGPSRGEHRRRPTSAACPLALRVKSVVRRFKESSHRPSSVLSTKGSHRVSSAPRPLAPVLLGAVFNPRTVKLRMVTYAWSHVHRCLVVAALTFCAGLQCKSKITLSGGSLGSCVDEERSQLRELM